MSPEQSAKKKKLLFAAITLLGAAFFLEAIASMVLLSWMRISKTETFTHYEPTYLSVINIPYRAGVRLGLFNRSKALESKYEFSRKIDDKGLVESNPQVSHQPRKKYEVTLSRRAIGLQDWEHLRVTFTKNADGTRWTGECPAHGADNVYIFGDSLVFGDLVNDEHTFSYLLQQARNDLCAKLFAVGGQGLPTVLLQFRELRHQIGKNNLIVIGYGDYLDSRTVVAPSRLREIRDFYKTFIGQEPKQALLPKAVLDNKGEVNITFVEQNCDYNNGYCEQNDPPQQEVSRLNSLIINEIADKTAARVFLLHLSGSKENPMLQMLSKSVRVISALPEDFDYLIKDDILGFDPHPGPWWHYAVSRKLIQELN